MKSFRHDCAQLRNDGFDLFVAVLGRSEGLAENDFGERGLEDKLDLSLLHKN